MRENRTKVPSNALNNILLSVLVLLHLQCLSPFSCCLAKPICRRTNIARRVGPHSFSLSPGLLLPLTSGDPKEDSVLVLLHLQCLSPFSCCLAKPSELVMNDLFCKLAAVKTNVVWVWFYQLNCSSVVGIVAEIVETTIVLLAREVENKIYKGGIVWISEFQFSKMSSHVIMSYPPPPPPPPPAALPCGR